MKKRTKKLYSLETTLVNRVRNLSEEYAGGNQSRMIEILLRDGVDYFIKKQRSIPIQKKIVLVDRLD